MGNERTCTDLALNSLKLTKVSVSVLKEAVRGGKLEIQFTGEIQTADETTVDKDRLGRLELTVALAGMERTGTESASEPEKAFEVIGTMVGTFRPKEGTSFSADEFSDCYDWISPQVYLPLREYLSYTLEKIGVRITLPLAVPLINQSEANRAQGVR